MSLKSAIVVALCGSTLASSAALGQENRISGAYIRIETSAPFVKIPSANMMRQSASVNEGFLCAYRLFPNNSHNTQTYSPHKESIGLKNNSDQVCVTYVFRFWVKRWSAIMPPNAPIFDPKTLTSGAPDFNLERPRFPRTEHRGSFYNLATLNTSGLNDLYRFSKSEVPAAVFGYNF